MSEATSIHSEFEREAVPASAQKSWKSFLGMYAGEHAAGTEFMIGPLFMTAGVSAFDLIVGLLVGNFLAVLSWRFLTAEIAVKARLTLYYHLEKYAGNKLVKLYSVANGILFCFLAGAMVTVSATAVGVPFGLAMPALSDVMPNSVSWVVIVIITGVIISVIAAWGYAMVSQVANYMAPVIIIGFLACGIVALGQLNIKSFGEFWALWGEGHAPFAGQIKYGFWHVMFWSWFCNAAMHIGMSDLSILRFAKKPGYGWCSAAGMYIGHYIAWIAAALLYAVYLKSAEAQLMLQQGQAPGVAPGPLAYNAIGFFGIVVVILAGWTTANPTIYRAGLAFQSLVPNFSRFNVTLFAGAVCTIFALFPAVAMRLLDFVALYGFILAPIGAIIAVEHFFPVEKRGVGAISWSVAIAWLGSCGVFYLYALFTDTFLSFLTLPAWLACGFVYYLLRNTLN